MDKPIFRTTIFFTEEKYKTTPASNIFLYADNKEAADTRAREVFLQQLKESGLGKAQFSTTTKPSSIQEAQEYVASKQRVSN